MITVRFCFAFIFSLLTQIELHGDLVGHSSSDCLLQARYIFSSFRYFRNFFFFFFSFLFFFWNLSLRVPILPSGVVSIRRYYHWFENRVIFSYLHTYTHTRIYLHKLTTTALEECRQK